MSKRRSCHIQALVEESGDRNLTRMLKTGHYRKIWKEEYIWRNLMYNTQSLNIVWVRKMGLKVYELMILSSLLLAVAVDAQNDFGEETSGPKGDKLPWFIYEINK